ncbi:MAG: 4-hydroxy-tetrahydrodipicolinate reductase [Bacteroidia bacterium]
MNIALLGYGKMGQIIEETAKARGHHISLIVDSKNAGAFNASLLKGTDVAIEFSTPQSVLNNINICLDAQTPLVIGTTGWNDHLDDIKRRCFEKEGSLVYGSNFSVGVNMLFSLNKILAGWMEQYPDYQPKVEEIHHKQKLDAPSGTAITLAEGILEGMPQLEKWESLEKEKEDTINLHKNNLPVFYSREEGVPGYHKVTYTSGIDEISISHNAFNRKGFALGAVMAAEFISRHKGFFTPQDIFNFK